jgi:hypothetical protein
MASGFPQGWVIQESPGQVKISLITVSQKSYPVMSAAFVLAWLSVERSTQGLNTRKAGALWGSS